MAQAIGLLTLNAASFESGNESEHMYLEADGAGGSRWSAPAGGGASYAVYTALLTQSGENAPVATVLENTLGGTPVWTRDDMGAYTVTLASAFTQDKTAVMPFITYDATSEKVVRLGITDTSNCAIGVQNLSAEAVEWGTAIPYFVEIRVYP